MVALTMALPNAPKTIIPSASRKRENEDSKLGMRRSRKAPYRSQGGGGGLANCGNKRDRTQGSDEKGSRENPGPGAIAIQQNCGQCDPVCRPTGPILPLLISVAAWPSFPAITKAAKTNAIWAMYFPVFWIGQMRESWTLLRPDGRNTS